MPRRHDDCSKEQERQAGAAAAALRILLRICQAAVAQHAADGAGCKEQQVEAVAGCCLERLLRKPPADEGGQQGEAGQCCCERQHLCHCSHNQAGWRRWAAAGLGWLACCHCSHRCRIAVTTAATAGRRVGRRRCSRRQPAAALGYPPAFCAIELMTESSLKLQTSTATPRSRRPPGALCTEAR